MPAGDYLDFFGEIYRLSPQRRRQRSQELLEKFGLQASARRQVGEFSKGMRQKLALARALIHDPPVLLLDEPTSAMDPASAHQVRRSIQLLRSEQRAVLICTHNLTEAEALADRLAIIRAGRLAAVGSVSELKQAFLGDPVMELRLVQAVDGAAGLLPDGARLAGTGADWLRYRTNDPQAVNPRVLEAMARAGLAVVTLSPVERSLEDVYLQAVGRPVEAS
jgi:ABC-2 type transport system ATP-binding protein